MKIQITGPSGILFLLILLCISLAADTSIYAQSHPNKTQPAVAAKAIEDLHNSLLVVRLPGFRKRIDYASGLMAAKDVELYDLAAEILVKNYTNRATLYQAYLSALKEEYDFSAVACIFDYEITAFLEGKVKPLGFDLETRIATDTFHGVFILTLDDVESSEASILTIRDMGLEPLVRPFPNAFISGGFSGLFSFLKEEHPAISQVNRMNTKLWRFYIKTAGARARSRY